MLIEKKTDYFHTKLFSISVLAFGIKNTNKATHNELHMCALSYLWLICVLCLCTFGSSQPTVQWGRVGHSLTGLLANQWLNEVARSEVIRLLPEVHGDLSQVAAWADEVRNRWSWSVPLHYINTPDWNCSYSALRDCPNQQCVDGAIQNYTARARNRTLPFEEQSDALKFLIHFIGDVHQPLHVGFAGDRGGNAISVTFLGKSTTLHAVWDTLLIDQRMKQQDNYPDWLAKRLQTDWQKNVSTWTRCAHNTTSFGTCSDEWAQESVQLACRHAYVDVDGSTRIHAGFNLDKEYGVQQFHVLDVQLAKAAMRMSNVLNRVFGM
jgi:hypothetical protein